MVIELRPVHIVVGLALTATALGGFGIGRSTSTVKSVAAAPQSRSPVAQQLARDAARVAEYRAELAGQVGEGRVRIIVIFIEDYFQHHGTYRGITLDKLRAEDPYLYQSGYVIPPGGLTNTSYCVQATVDGRTWSKTGPAGAVTETPCG